MHKFQNAIVRPPASNFADGLTTVDLGKPDYKRALEQFEKYCRALEICGLSLTRLPIEEQYPDSTFVEDTAILTSRGTILTRPGAPSRAGEVESMQITLEEIVPNLGGIVEPGTLDGGDVCEANGHFFIGISQRTNDEGARQLGAWLGGLGYSSTYIDIRDLSDILHLKSDLAFIGENHLVVTEKIIGLHEYPGFELLQVAMAEDYAANCVHINDYVLIASGYPQFESRLQELDYQTIALDMSEYEKMDGGLSCLSLRY